MEIRVRRAIGFVVGVAVVLGVMATPAMAVTYGADFASVAGDIAGGVVGSLTNELLGGGEDHGSLTTTVYKNAAGTLYTYEAKVTPLVGGISFFSTSFGVLGLTGKVGWSFLDAGTAGAPTPAAAFDIGPLPDSSLQWTKLDDFWNTTDASGKYPSIRFFFQSSLSPGIASWSVYNIQNSVFGQGVGLAPVQSVPEPMTLLLLSSGFLGAGLWIRWGRRAA